MDIIEKILILILIIISIFFLFKKEKKETKEVKKEKIICKTCNGTGQTKQDVNLLMTEASIAIWMNNHIMTDKCEICSKNKGIPSCENAKKVYEERMQNYKKNGPRMKMADCPDCLGMGGYWQYPGFRFKI